MKLSEFKNTLATLKTISFRMPDGKFIEPHIHVTEVGMLNKQFIDCGGIVRTETKVAFQLWKDDNDIDHRLSPEKLFGIINLSEKQLNIEDQEIEVEYQAETIGKYGVDFNGFEFVLTNMQTACLAEDSCGIPIISEELDDKEAPNGGGCNPNSGCC
jgi:hypothetical protein